MSLRILFIGVLLGMLFSCQENSKKTVSSEPKIALEQLEGYWEIAFVTHANETFYPKRGGIPLWDFYQLNKSEGFRKKGQPTFNGRFQTSEVTTTFEIRENSKGFALVFKTPLDSWEEEIIALDSLQLVLAHHNKEYHYNRRQLQ